MNKIAWCLSELDNNKDLEIKPFMINDKWNSWCNLNKIPKYSTINFKQEINGIIKDVSIYLNKDTKDISYNDIKQYAIDYKNTIDLIYNTIKQGFKGFVYFTKLF